MTDFWICRDERGFKIATAKQCGVPRRAGIHLQESPVLRAISRGYSGTFPVRKGQKGKRQEV